MNNKRVRTRGIWNQLAPEGLDACCIVDKHGHIVASSQFNRQGGRTLGEMIANARLMASAPDLLEACKVARTHLPTSEKSIADKLDAAIKKAEDE